MLFYRLNVRDRSCHVCEFDYCPQEVNDKIPFANLGYSIVVELSGNLVLP